MNAHNKDLLKLLCVLSIWVPGAVQAATPFDPDWTAPTTMVTQPVGYVGAPRGSGYILTSSQALYMIDYSAQDWSGNMHSYPLSSSGTVNTATDNWFNGSFPGAAAQIDDQNFDTGRYIVTMNGSTGVAFRWANLSATQKTALDSVTAATAVTSPVLNYIRGDRSNEIPNGNLYRKRGSVLGDIIHSTPLPWNDGTNRTVFVGANDGMLHAINAVDGTERFAYIPSTLIAKLPNLKTAGYAHKYFVDGQLAALKYGNQSVLVGGLGGGGRGLFALDITAVPTSEVDAASKILWEITNATAGYANLGHTYGTPVLTTLPDGTAVLLVGNGYNNTGNGHSALFLINPTSGAKIAEIDAGTGTAAAPNGLSSPTVVDVDLDGQADYAYAGDIDGTLWKFDLAARTATNLYTTSPAQAITMAPGYKKHPNGGYMVTVVTGRNFIATDATDTATHNAYGIWDRPAAYAVNDTMLTQTLTETNYTAVTPNIRVRTASNTLPDWSAGAGHHMGWKTPLPIGGERVLGDGAYVTGPVFLFLSTNPTVNPTATPPGENWWMQLNALTGGDNGAPRFDLNADGLFTPTDQVSGMSPVGRHMGGGVRSQLTEFSTTGYEIYLANYDLNGDPPYSTSVSSTNNRGVSGGHFDFDVYCSTNCKDGKNPTAGRYFLGTDAKGFYYTHVHEYDDIYDVTGVDMLNPSQALDKLSRVRVGTMPLPATTAFKVLVANQAYSPAAKVSIGGGDYVNVYQYEVVPGLTVASLPTYTLATVGTLMFNLPLDGFQAKDWGTGIVRSGLHPIKWSCAVRNAIDGPLGEWRNGALTFQIVKATVSDSDIQLNVTGHPELGYRLKTASKSQLIAEYTTFWHHPNNKCMGDSGWTKSPPQDNISDVISATPATGSTDPRDGIFGQAGAGAVPGTTTTTVTNADGTTTTTTVTVVVNADGSVTTTTTITNSGGGTTTTTTTDSIEIGGAVDASGVIGGGVTTPLEALGRVDWRELLQ